MVAAGFASQNQTYMYFYLEVCNHLFLAIIKFDTLKCADVFCNCCAWMRSAMRYKKLLGRLGRTEIQLYL